MSRSQRRLVGNCVESTYQQQKVLVNAQSSFADAHSLDAHGNNWLSDFIAVLDEGGKVVLWPVCAASHKPTSVHEHDHRQRSGRLSSTLR